MRSFRGALQGRIETLTIRVIHYNHDEIELDHLYIPSFSNQEVNGIYADYKNITGYSQTSELINNAEKYQTITMMASGVAHEIRNPLTSLRGFCNYCGQISVINKNIRIMSSTAYTADCEGCSDTMTDGTDLNGDAVAADTGSDINGNKVDLHMGDEEESNDWGNQEVEVTVKE